ncbi:MAG: 7,8-didemethyl-8-hydroxy-5-deazariboflavin synthase CofG [Chloroflexi bacterium]|nr:7,8-didemethyl-8-hydroxy-5-deazariboflavin synthase CofG [Chloroflexota bacterium]
MAPSTGPGVALGARTPVGVAPVSAGVSREEACALVRCDDAALPSLLQRASALRDQGKGRYISYSRKVFISLVNLCRDVCSYCTYRREPGDPAAGVMTPDQVLAVAEAGQRAACTEALFMAGERPEQRYPEAREALRRFGHTSTIDYMRAMCDLVSRRTSLLPHSNPGTMTRAELESLKEVNASLGMMLESSSPRLLLPGGPHRHAPSKHPRLRLRTLETAGELRIPFTTGVLVGIGETPEEVVDSLFTIKDVHDRYGHVQEVIVQNFRAKTRTPMADCGQPTTAYMLRVVAVARLIFGPEMNIQVPPNLTPHEYGAFLSAGINDWGGVSPVTQDYVNPEAPWPQIARLRQITEERGFLFKARLPVYPEYILRKPDFLPAFLADRIRQGADAEGYARIGLSSSSGRD